MRSLHIQSFISAVPECLRHREATKKSLAWWVKLSGTVLMGHRIFHLATRKLCYRELEVFGFKVVGFFTTTSKSKSFVNRNRDLTKINEIMRKTLHNWAQFWVNALLCKNYLKDQATLRTLNFVSWPPQADWKVIRWVGEKNEEKLFSLERISRMVRIFISGMRVFCLLKEEIKHNIDLEDGWDVESLWPSAFHIHP